MFTAKSDEDSLTLKVMHWNILADKLAHGSFDKVPVDYLKWSYRFHLIKQHIIALNPDVIGLSEVDVLPLYREIADFMNNRGYSDYFVEKPNGISGSAIFYRKDKFSCLAQNSVIYDKKASQFFMYCKLVRKTPSSTQVGSSKKMEFIFGETHLKAKEQFVKERVQQTQKIKEFFDTNHKDLPVIMGGDFNEIPANEPIAEVMESSFVDLYTLIGTGDKYPAFTTYKYREESGFVKRTIDYMFVAKNEWLEKNKIDVLAYITPENVPLDTDIGNPCVNHPSDHYSLAYEVKLNYN